MIYQMPDVALNPQQTLLETIGRPVEFYFQRSKRQVRERVLELLRQMELPETFHRPQDQRAFGRTEAARVDRPRARRRARSHHLRRGHLGARSARRRGDPAAAETAAGRARGRLPLHHPRPRHGEAHRQQSRGHAEGQDWWRAARPSTIFAPPYHPYTELLLSAVPEMRPEWLDEVLARRAARRTPKGGSASLAGSAIRFYTARRRRVGAAAGDRRSRRAPACGPFIAWRDNADRASGEKKRTF